jgi:hypothetical protein
MKVLRSVASIVVSYAVVFVLVLISDPILNRLFPGQAVAGKIPPTLVLEISTAIFTVASIIGGWLCVRLAPANAGLHLLILFVLGEIAGAIPAVINWNNGWPHWYPISWLLAWPICLWIGGLGRRATTRTAATVGAD